MGFRLYNDAASGQVPGSATFVDSTFSNIKEAAIEMATPADKSDSGFTGLVLDNVNLGGQIKDYGSSKEILKAGYYKNVSLSSTVARQGRPTDTAGVCHWHRVQKRANMD